MCTLLVDHLITQCLLNGTKKAFPMLVPLCDSGKIRLYGKHPYWNTPLLSWTMGALLSLLVWVCLCLCGMDGSWYWAWHCRSQRTVPFSLIGPPHPWNTIALLCLRSSLPWKRHMIGHGQDIESPLFAWFCVWALELQVNTVKMFVLLVA